MGESEPLDKNVKAAEVALKAEKAAGGGRKAAGARAHRRGPEGRRPNCRASAPGSSRTSPRPPTSATSACAKAARASRWPKSVEGRCTACHIALRPQYFQDLRRGESGYGVRELPAHSVLQSAAIDGRPDWRAGPGCKRIVAVERTTLIRAGPGLHADAELFAPAVFLQLIVQRLEADPQDLRGPRLVVRVCSSVRRIRPFSASSTVVPIRNECSRASSAAAARSTVARGAARRRSAFCRNAGRCFSLDGALRPPESPRAPARCAARARCPASCGARNTPSRPARSRVTRHSCLRFSRRSAHSAIGRMSSLRPAAAADGCERRSGGSTDLRAGARPHCLVRHFVGGGHHPHVHFEFGLAAQAAHLGILQDAQQLGLRRHAASRRSRPAAACRAGPARSSRRAVPMAPVNEPFSCPNSSLSISVSGSAAQLMAIERALPARAQRVERARHHFFAGAALAGDQHAGFARPGLLQQGEDLLHLGGDADQFARARPCSRTASPGSVLGAQPGMAPARRTSASRALAWIGFSRNQ